MSKFISILLLGFVPQLAMSQVDQSQFDKLMDIAKVRKIIQVDTVAGKTNVSFTSIVDDPRFVFVFAPGGAGNPRFSGKEGPFSSWRLPFLEKKAAWAVIGAPEEFEGGVNRLQRLDKRHIEAIAQVAQKLRAEYPKAKHILIGHSNGGITAGMQAIQPKPVFDGIVFSAPVQGYLPWGWDEQVNVPIMFITHKDDECKMSASFLVISAAGKKFPITVIESPSSGSYYECSRPPAPHFFTGVQVEYADAILKWAASLK